MTQVCQITGKRPGIGNTVSHANNKTKRRFNINLHEKRFWLEEQKRFIKLRVSARGMRIIDKIGLEKVLANLADYNIEG
ncbi:MAG: 50S ribosomal protein L28 [Gammaproteobacteria bacterium]|nr:50S ribosomal protein L28 [Gammaproteobacteria bacterium]